MANTIQTIWKLILADDEAQKSEGIISRLANALQDKLGNSSTSAVEKTTDAIREQTEALKAEEAQAAATGEAVSSSSKAGGIGKPSELISKFSSVGRMAGIPVEQIAGIAKAAEGVQQLAAASGLLTPAAEAAGAASAAAAPGLLASAAGFAAVLLPLAPLIIAIGAVVAVLAILKQADDQRAADLKKEAELRRAVSDEIAAGATKEDIEAEIAALKERDDLEKSTLADGKKAYDDYLNSIRNAFGGLGRLLEPFIKLFGAQEQQLADNVNDSQKLLDENAKKENAYQEALDRGDTAKNDAAKREEELTKSREKTAADTAKAAEKSQADQEKTIAKQQAVQEKAASDAQRLAEQQAAKEQQAAEKRYQAGVKYSDALVDIAQKATDSARAALKTLKDKQADDTRAFWQDIGDLSTDFQAKEREESIKRGEEEVQDALNQTRKLSQIREEAAKNEQDALRGGDYLGATRIREQANAQMESENKTFKDQQGDKIRAQQAEDAAQLRELDQARHKRLAALQRANEEAQIAYRRDLENQRETRRIALREAAESRNRELRATTDMAKAVLGIKQQQGQAELQLAQSTLSQLRGIHNVTNNNGNTMNGNISMHFSAPGGFSASSIRSQVYNVLDGVGLTRR
jgi:hypothetical protein